jgi:hypothetical protein
MIDPRTNRPNRTTLEDTMNTTPENLDFTATTPAGNTYQVAVYVDPFPGRKGSDRIRETCGKCAGDGVIHYGNLTLRANGVSGRVCFMCMGKGYTSRLVSSARSTARNQVKAENVRRAQAADYAANNAEREQAELLADWDAALAEQARRDALVTGFVAEIGTRVRGLLAEVKVAYRFDTTDYHGRPDSKVLTVLEVQGTGQVVKAVLPYCQFGKGELVKVTGTVKAHDNYRGQDQTVLQRVKLEAGK